MADGCSVVHPYYYCNHDVTTDLRQTTEELSTTLADPPPPNINNFPNFHLLNLDCFKCLINPTSLPNLQNECSILFIMYFVIAPNANKMRTHTDQLMISKGMCVVYFESWPCQIDC